MRHWEIVGMAEEPMWYGILRLYDAPVMSGCYQVWPERRLRFNSHLRQNILYFRPYLRRRPTEWSVGGLSYRFWYAKSCLQQAFSRLCVVIATVGYAHRVQTLGEDGVGKHSPF